jgi:23S rRNA pseudouridine2605 synthase
MALGTIANPGDRITVKGTSKVLKEQVRPRIWLYHKPAGLVTTHRDEKGRLSVFDDLKTKIPERVISVGRLDLNSEGLLILTNSGEFARRAETSNWPRTYRLRLFGKLSPEARRQIEKGLTIDGIRYGPMQIKEISGEGRNIWLTCTIREGKNRELRRIFNHFGLQVSRLIRIAYGPFELRDLAKGKTKEIKGDEYESYK